MSITAILEGAKDLQATLGEDEVMTAEMDSEGFIAKDGGFYTPSVSNVNENTVEFSFAASEEGMPAVPGVQVKLPQGPKGKPGEPGQPGRDGKDGIVGKDGEPGKDGVSATHSWNGTTLTITSASGTSSANLKGEQGNPGKDGEKGDSGVYVGSGDMPEDCNVQIDPTGEALSVDLLVAAVIAKLPIYSGEVVAV